MASANNQGAAHLHGGDCLWSNRSRSQAFAGGARRRSALATTEAGKGNILARQPTVGPRPTYCVTVGSASSRRVLRALHRIHELVEDILR